jgi:hypothetical protein
MCGCVVVCCFSIFVFNNRCVLAELEEPIYSKIYGPEWEGGENVSNVFVVTLADYFQDLSTWIPMDYFKVFVKEVMIFSVDRYVMYLRRRSNGVFVFNNELNAANRVLNDKLVIQEFFESHMLVQEAKEVDDDEDENDEEEDDAAQEIQIIRNNAAELKEARILIKTTFEPIINLACVISARHPSAVDADVRMLFKKWGMDGTFINLFCNHLLVTSYRRLIFTLFAYFVLFLYRRCCRRIKLFFVVLFF